MLLIALSIVLCIAAFIAGIVVHAAIHGRKSGDGTAEELRRMGFDIFFGFLTSRLGGAIARRLTARRA